MQLFQCKVGKTRQVCRNLASLWSSLVMRGGGPEGKEAKCKARNSSSAKCDDITHSDRQIALERKEGSDERDKTDVGERRCLPFSLLPLRWTDLP